MAQVIVLIGAGSIGQAIVRRVSAGKHVLLADLRQENAEAAAKTLLMGPDGGFITGSDFLMDGGVTAAYWFGELAPR
jgi:predicted dinucleotide-binding enzyme